MTLLPKVVITCAIVSVAAWAIFLLGQRNAWHSNVSFLMMLTMMMLMRIMMMVMTMTVIMMDQSVV